MTMIGSIVMGFGLVGLPVGMLFYFLIEISDTLKKIETKLNNPQ